MSNRPESWQQGIRWRPFVNESDEVMPAFACGALPVSVDGTVETQVSRVIGGRSYLRVRKPDRLAWRQQNRAFIVFNGPVAVPPGKLGECTQDYPALAMRAYLKKPIEYLDSRSFTVPGIAGEYIDHGLDSGTSGDTAPQSPYAGPADDEWGLRNGLAFSVSGRPREGSHDLIMIDGQRSAFRLFHDAYAPMSPTSPTALNGRLVEPQGQLFASPDFQTDSVQSIVFSQGRSEIKSLIPRAPLDQFNTTDLANVADTSPSANLLYLTDPTAIAGYKSTLSQVVRDGLYWVDVSILATSYFEDEDDYADESSFQFRLRVTAYDSEWVPTLYPTSLVSYGAEDLQYNNPVGDVPSDYTAVRSRYAMAGWLPLRAGWLLHVISENTRHVQVEARWSVFQVGEVPANCDVPWSELLYA